MFNAQQTHVIYYDFSVQHNEYPIKSAWHKKIKQLLNTGRLPFMPVLILNEMSF